MAETARLARDLSDFDSIEARLSDAEVLWELARSEHDEANDRDRAASVL